MAGDQSEKGREFLTHFLIRVCVMYGLGFALLGWILCLVEKF